MSDSARTRLRRLVGKAPEAMVKVTGRSRGMAGHLRTQLDYITRDGRLPAETQNGQRIVDHDSLCVLHDEWLVANAIEARGRSSVDAAQSMTIVLSMPPGTPSDKLEAAARAWARDTFQGTHDWLMARHDDTDHPHVHVAVRAVGHDGRRLAPGPDDLQRWRERFALELRHRGVEAEATPRQARGVVRKAPTLPALKAGQRGATPHQQAVQEQLATHEALAPEPAATPSWSRHLQERQASIRQAYLVQADALLQGDSADRDLAHDIRRFVATMPVPLTRQQALAVEHRYARAQQDSQAPPEAVPSDVSEPLPSPRLDLPKQLDAPSLPAPYHQRRGR